MADVVSWVGAATGVMSLIILIYQAGYRWGQLTTKVDLLWKVYAEGALLDARHNGATESHSRYRVTEKGMTFLTDDLKGAVDGLIARNHDLPGKPLGVIASAVVENFSSAINKVALEKDLSPTVIIGVIIAYVQEQNAQ